LGGAFLSISCGQSGKVPWQLGNPRRFIDWNFRSVGLIVLGRVFLLTVIHDGLVPWLLKISRMHGILGLSAAAGRSVWQTGTMLTRAHEPLITPAEPPTLACARLDPAVGKGGGSLLAETHCPIELSRLTKTFTVKKQLQEKELGLVNLVKRTVLRKRTKEKLTALNEVSFKVEKGEIFGLLGPNGAGKTTLVKTLCTLLWPNSGTALINGYDIRKYPKETRRSLGTVLDIHMGWYGRLSCRQNLLFYGQLFGLRAGDLNSKAKEVMELVGLSEKADEWQQKLSTGMKRKLDLARALLPDPPILLLDEPTLGLDVKSARDFRGMVRDRLCGEMGKTVLWTTHNMEEANKICDGVAILHKGRLLALGKPDGIKQMAKTANVVVAEVDRADKSMVQAMEDTPGVRAVSSTESKVWPGLYTLRIEIEDRNAVSAISAAIVSSGASLYSLTMEEVSLEDALIWMTEGNQGMKEDRK